MRKITDKAIKKSYVTVLLLSLLFVLASLPSALAATVQGKVTSIKDRQIELDVGADKGVKVGDTGRVYWCCTFGAHNAARLQHGLTPSGTAHMANPALHLTRRRAGSRLVPSFVLAARR